MLEIFKFDVLIVAGVLIQGCGAVDYCYSAGIYYTYCEDGYYCCQGNTKCCSNVVLSVGAIIGIVIGSLAFLGFLSVVVCCFVKSKGHAGRVVAPHQSTGGNVTVISTGQYTQQQHLGHTYYPQYGQLSQQQYGGQPSHVQSVYPQQPPPYETPSFGQQSKAGTNDPAYPPPPPTY